MRGGRHRGGEVDVLLAVKEAFGVRERLRAN